MCGRESVTTDV